MKIAGMTLFSSKSFLPLISAEPQKHKKMIASKKKSSLKSVYFDTVILRTEFFDHFEYFLKI
jgi:hypothetical protein